MLVKRSDLGIFVVGVNKKPHICTCDFQYFFFQIQNECFYGIVFSLSLLCSNLFFQITSLYLSVTNCLVDKRLIFQDTETLLSNQLI